MFVLSEHNDEKKNEGDKAACEEAERFRQVDRENASPSM